MRFVVLDSFRGLFAIFVALFHMRFLNTFTELSFFRGSHIFVEFFFVLSGFVLAHGYGYKTPSFTSFIRSRFFRLYPLHITMFFVFFLFEIGKLLAYKYVHISFNNIPFVNRNSPVEILPNILLLQSWLSFTNSESFNYPSWSISLEFYIYVVFFFSLVRLKKIQGPIWITAFALLMLFKFNSTPIVKGEIKQALFCFFLGASTYYAYLKLKTFKLSRIVANYLEACSMILIIIIVSSTSTHKGSIAPMVFALSICLFAFEKGVISNLMKSSLLQELGKLSYSIYMIHAAILFFTTSVFMIFNKIFNLNFTPMINGTRFIDSGSMLFNTFLVLLLTYIIILISRLSYHYIELKGIELSKGFK